MTMEMVRGLKFCLHFSIVNMALVTIALSDSLRPLGRHTPPTGTLRVTGEFPDPFVFYSFFVKPGEPLLMKNVLKAENFPAYAKWNDEYMREKYGEEEVQVEHGKKENRSEKYYEFTLNRFLSIYNKSNLYMVHDIPKQMAGDVYLPSSLQCGGFEKNLDFSVMWFSSGETKSVLHYDGADNINCLLDGRKEFVLIDKKHKDLVERDGFEKDGTFSTVDVEKVDLDKFPGLKEAPWYEVNMTKGDCLFIPFKWYHHVHSLPGRNLAVNHWFFHLWWFNNSDCERAYSEGPLESRPLNQFTKASELELVRSQFLSIFEDKSSISAVEFLEVVRCPRASGIKMFKFLDVNKDHKLEWEELYRFKMEYVMETFHDCISALLPTYDNKGQYVDTKDEDDNIDKEDVDLSNIANIQDLKDSGDANVVLESADKYSMKIEKYSEAVVEEDDPKDDSHDEL
ncbi:hypothetical protein CHS0354_012457 [Potamilus streckersoni]|uniref:JmjC domain-containing protein n=1 Tax=Potamilus streckersoni TaxID=2493646 RepID=A0AAE0VJH7_9BIVA|nr:hypothetical protein CHS0354_012457 [Potamilus streckersoni]